MWVSGAVATEQCIVNGLRQQICFDAPAKRPHRVERAIL